MPKLVLIPSDGPSEQQLAEIEAGVRASVITDFLKARSRGDSLAQLEAEYLAAQIDRSTPDGPRLSDELDALRQSTAA
ncbi:hypothetical protein OG259_07710 [Streptomyces sp. NBC_00250]|uniref:hypothetical protein n=1 Tax=Streptomyces sp. NBC_00250 TaxID=2903641 RepID=UPI002E2A0944|nr:hypothetical protein [Streptomyces sp. NBC_00250]